jgi:hypothetical protein
MSVTPLFKLCYLTLLHMRLTNTYECLVITQTLSYRLSEFEEIIMNRTQHRILDAWNNNKMVGIHDRITVLYSLVLIDVRVRRRRYSIYW